MFEYAEFDVSPTATLFVLSGGLIKNCIPITILDIKKYYQDIDALGDEQQRLVVE